MAARTLRWGISGGRRGQQGMRARGAGMRLEKDLDGDWGGTHRPLLELHPDDQPPASG